ncbi:hypothetical protein [Aureliella helgolandensis]|uniref:IncA protein n=1 Tax=Aureliella helgolandensis TaxID=2527968 RepID=A0A518GH26_9BACT|nr:hypothetical protein [Aureliella helgolandensis]QDV27884.1 hypothetical protein Q31a_62770 [Aureliella helgolandensis]
MSSARRQRDSVAPSLFPFLAVLLCTMGALVLILMLIVAGAQASATQVITEQQEQVEEIESQITLARRAFEKQLSGGRIELEKKRLHLQHLENHIQELLEELAHLQRTAELMDEESQEEQAEQESITQAITELEKQLADAHKKLEQKLDKPDGDKPIFAIIPYDGPNGTHRRPIYLECTEQGLIIQPEGLLVSVDDLQPPYGPGNPLDAALRTIRSTYVPENHAVTSTAYPLLVVRPSGIRTYSLARSAMNAWDDQFGYELVDEELELVFPAGEPGLRAKIASAIELARERQAALVMAMPRKFRQQYRDNSSGSSGSASSGSGSSDPMSSGYQGGLPTGDSREGAPGERGGYALNGSNSASGQNSSAGGSGGYGFAQSEIGTASENRNDGVVTEASLFAANHSGDTADYSGNSAAGVAAGQGASSFFGDNQYSGVGQTGQDLLNQPAGASAAGGQTGNSSAGAAGQSTAAAGTGGGSSAQSTSSGGNQVALPSFGMRTSSTGAPGGQPPTGPSSTDEATASGGSYSGGSSSPTNGPTSGSNPPPTAGGQGSSSSRPVAAHRGRDWAWSQGPPTQTPVVRNIRVVCYEDRWVILADPSSGSSETSISMDSSPQQRAESLAKLIQKRVEGWGIALTSGYWKPVLVVDVAPNADWRFEQLTRLFEGSGLDVRRAP